MRSSLTNKVSVKINAPVEQVWKALTDPKLIKQYFFDTNAHTDWEVGSKVTFSGTYAGKNYIDKGTVKEKIVNKHLKYSYWGSMSGIEDKPENYADISYDLEEVNGQTMLTVTQENIPDEKMKEHSDQNWRMVLDNLKKMLEKPAAGAS